MQNGRGQSVRVLIADDEPEMLAVLRDLLAREDGIHVAGAATDAREAAELAAELSPDVALLDVRMPRGGGPLAAAEIRRVSPRTVAIALSAAQDRESVMAMFDAGAVGYLVKGGNNSDIVRTIREAAESTRAAEERAAAAANRNGNRLRVLVADDDSYVREALVDVLGGAPSIEVVGAAADALEAVSLAHHHRPDVALVDSRMPGGGGAHAVREIHEALPETRVVVLSARASRDAVREMLEAGATSYLVKGASNLEIVDAVRDAAAGKPRISSEVGPAVLEELIIELARSSHDESRNRAARKQRIVRVVEAGGPETVFQPIFDLQAGEVVGVEALSRFPDGGRRGPNVWFGEAKEAGLGVELEVSAVAAALGCLNGFPSSKWVSLNVSPETACSPLLATVLGAAKGRSLVIEMTEHAAVEDYAALGEALARLRASGVRVAVDDAGSGFASLRHILMLDPEFIKLDISLTRGIASDAARRALARALTTFGEEIGGTVIAEGVETQEDLDALAGLGVPCGQGFHLARPGPPDVVLETAPA